MSATCGGRQMPSQATPLRATRNWLSSRQLSGAGRAGMRCAAAIVNDAVTNCPHPILVDSLTCNGNAQLFNGLIPQGLLGRPMSNVMSLPKQQEEAADKHAGGQSDIGKRISDIGLEIAEITG